MGSIEKKYWSFFLKHNYTLFEGYFGKTYSFDENHKEPFERIENGVEVELIKVLLDLWEEFRNDFVMMRQEAR